jgi:PST family polysaccharide transporter
MTEAPGARGTGGLGQTALLGSIFHMGGRGIRALVGIGTIAVLSRFLTPSEFGAFALISVIVAFAQIFADFGLRSALVQKSDVSDAEMNSVFWVSILMGAVLSGAIWLSAGILAKLFEAETIVAQIQLTALVFILAAPRSVPLTKLERAFRFREIAAIELIGAVAGAVAAIGFAVAGARIGALVAQQLTMVIVMTVLTVASARWWPRLQFSWATIKPLTGFGNYVTLSAAIQFLSGNIDKPVVGTRLSAADLGYLTMGGQIVMSPIRIITQNIRRVTFPIMASIKDDNERIAQGHNATLHALFLMLTPVCIGLSALAEPLTRVLLGPNWAAVGPIVIWLALAVLIGSIGDLNAAIFNSKGKARFLFFWSIGSLGANILLLILTVPYGLMAIVWGRFCLVIALIALQSFALGQTLGVSPLRFLSGIWRPLAAGAVMGVVVAALDHLLAGMGQGALVRIIAGVPVGALVYGGLILLVDRPRAMGLAQRILKIRSA